jgi:hypothetical protein
VDILYGRLKGMGLSVTPLVVNACQPTPSLGYLNRERTDFMQRGTSDCVIALALLHHLLVSGNLSLESCRDLFMSLTTDSVVLEFVPVDDPMFRKLTKFRTVDFSHVTLNACVKVFSEAFDVVDIKPLPEVGRQLLLMQKKTGITKRGKGMRNE